MNNKTDGPGGRFDTPIALTSLKDQAVEIVPKKPLKQAPSIVRARPSPHDSLIGAV